MTDTSPDFDESAPPAAPDAAASAAAAEPVEPPFLVEPAAEQPIVDAAGAEPVAESAQVETYAEPAAEPAAMPGYAEQPAAAPAEQPYVAPAAYGDPAVPPFGAPVAPMYTDPAAQYATPQQPVYVAPPVPPKKKGNRGVGILFAVLGTLAFALLFSGAIFVVLMALGSSGVFTEFLMSTGFLVPTVTFLVVFILAVLLVNRAGWWAWAITSLIVAALTYFASIGVILLLNDVIAMAPSQAIVAFNQLAVSAPLIAAALIAREVTLWFGLAIAARGRKVKARNVAAREEFDREQAARPAQMQQSYPQQGYPQQQPHAYPQQPYPPQQ